MIRWFPKNPSTMQQEQIARCHFNPDEVYGIFWNELTKAVKRERYDDKQLNMSDKKLYNDYLESNLKIWQEKQ